MISPTNPPTVLMMRVKLAAHLLMILLFNGSGKLNAQPKTHFQANGKSINISALDREIKLMMDEVGVHGLSMAVIDNNQIVFSQAYGSKQSDQEERVEASTVFEACSMSKSFLVFVAHQLVDEGKLDLDRPIHEYLPNKDLEYDSRYQQITGRMILCHSSGLENWKYANDGNKLEILSNPGKKYIYSGQGYNYLADAIEKILNKPYEQYIKERVLKQLHLKNTYLQYTDDQTGLFRRTSPRNYTVGYDFFGDEVGKWKNRFTDPASGCHTTAQDYAKLIIATFNGNNLSNARIKAMMSPGVLQKEEDSTLYYGPGFEIIYSKNDTVLSQGGSNPGFKARLYYSPGNKCGLVFFTNSDRGELMTSKLNELTVGLDLNQYPTKIVFGQYPSTFLKLLKIYRNQQEPAMFAEIEKLKSDKKSIDEKTLNDLGWRFMDHNLDISKKILEESVALNPQSPNAYQLLGQYYSVTEDYSAAYTNFSKAKEFNYPLPEIEKNLTECKAKLAEAARRDSMLFSIVEQGESVIQAEDYNLMRGIKLQTTSDHDGNMHVGFIDTDDWMNYKVNTAAAGVYSVAFRITCFKGGSQIQLRSGTKVLTTVDLPATNSWSNWATVMTQVNLPAGSQTLNVYASTGGFTLNWIKFSTLVAGNKQ